MREQLISWAEKYNDPRYFREDPIAFPTRFFEMMKRGCASLQDVEISAMVAAHLAWGRRCMIVRDCGRAFDEMGWKPYDYVMRGKWRCGDESLHRTVKWSEFAAICCRLRDFYSGCSSAECLSPDQIRTLVYGQKSDLRAANKKIHMMRRWMVRRDGIVDFGIWKNISPDELVIPLDTHVHTQAMEMSITQRKSTDITTALEITDYFRDIFPGDPCRGDFALFGYGVTNGGTAEDC